MRSPFRLAELTVEWLNEILSAKGLLGTARITAFDAAPMSGQGGTSLVYLLTFTYDHSSALAPKKAVAKFSSESEMVREALRDYRLYQREITFYSQFGADPGIPTPRFYAADHDARENRCFLLLEYIEHSHMREMHDGSPADVELAIGYLAAFHAKWWERKKDLEGIESENAPGLLELRIQKVKRAFERVREKFRADFGEVSIAIVELWLAHAHALAEYSRRRPLTMCHGSFHRGQILFPDSDRDSFYVIDWQSVSVDSGAIDLSRIIVSGLLPDQRREHEERFVELYYRGLLAGGVANYSLEDLWGDYRMGIINLIIFHTQIFADYDVGIVSRHWKGRDSFWDALFHWPANAAWDRGAVDWLRKIVISLPVRASGCPG
jgi:aminoglycoside phosphotransferase (APT) family kinase protein